MSIFKDLFKNKTQNIETKSLPEQTLVSIQNWVQAPLNLSRSPAELVSLNTGYVYDCVKMLATSVASAPLKIYTTKQSNGKKMASWVQTKALSNKQLSHIKSFVNKIQVKTAEDIVEITNHPVNDLLNNVNDSLDAFTFFELIEQYLAIIGNCFVEIVKDKSGTPEHLNVLASEYVSCLLDKYGTVVGYRLQLYGTGSQRDFSVSDIIHFKQPVAGAFRRPTTDLTPITALYGMGELEACLTEVELYQQINQFERSLFMNNCRPDFVIKYSAGKLEESVKNKLQKQFNQYFRGVKQAFKALITDTQFDIIPLEFGVKDLSFSEGKKYLRCAIMNAFGVDESFFTVENSNRASSQVAIEKYLRLTITPKLRRIQEALNAKLMPLYDDNLFCAYSEVIPQDYDAEIKQTDSDIKLGIRSVNEVRIERGLEPIPGDAYDLPHRDGDKGDTNAAATNIQ